MVWMGRTFLYNCASSCEGMTVATCRGTTREEVLDELQTGVLGVSERKRI